MNSQPAEIPGTLAANFEKPSLIMNKYLKGCLIFVVIATVLIILFFHSINSNKKDFEDDKVKYSKICDTIQEIKEKPKFVLEGFQKSEINEMSYYLIRKNKIVKDTTLFFDTAYINIFYFQVTVPFDQFRKTDTIVIKTSSDNYFSVSNFHYYAYLHFGNFGYLGSYDCRCAETDYTVNGLKIKDEHLKKSFSSDKTPL